MLEKQFRTGGFKSKWACSDIGCACFPWFQLTTPLCSQSRRSQTLLKKSCRLLSSQSTATLSCNFLYSGRSNPFEILLGNKISSPYWLIECPWRIPDLSWSPLFSGRSGRAPVSSKASEKQRGLNPCLSRCSRIRWNIYWSRFRDRCRWRKPRRCKLDIRASFFWGWSGQWSSWFLRTGRCRSLNQCFYWAGWKCGQTACSKGCRKDSRRKKHCFYPLVK